MKELLLLLTAAADIVHGLPGRIRLQGRQATTTAPIFRCNPFQDPNNDLNNTVCQCSSGIFVTTLPLVASTGIPYNLCGYTTFPASGALTTPPTVATSSLGKPVNLTFVGAPTTVFVAPGALETTVSGIPVSVSSSSHVVISGSTLSPQDTSSTGSTAAGPVPTGVPVVLTVGNNPTTVFIAPESPETFIDGIPVSVDASGDVIISGSTSFLANATAPTASTSAFIGVPILPTLGEISTTAFTVLGASETTIGGIPVSFDLSSDVIISGSTSFAQASATGLPSARPSATGSITAPPVLSTFSLSSISTQSTSIIGVSSNTEITTDNNGHSTILPYLFNCWFCGGGGLLLWHIGPAPGIYPPPVPPPFPGWPTITIGNDNVPRPDPSKDPSPSNTLSTVSQTASSSGTCTTATVTDYWVSCGSVAVGTTSSCTTYSSSLVTGCNATPFVTTTVPSCTAPASVDSDDLRFGQIAGPEYDFYDPRSEDPSPDWSYTVAVIASTGMVGASPGSSPTLTPASTVNSASVTTTAFISGSPQATTTSLASLLCIPFQDPDHGDAGHCDCSSGSFTTSLPMIKSTNKPCGYTTLTIPAASTTTVAPITSNNNPFPFTTTDDSGNVIACASSSLLYLAVAGGLTIAKCGGSSTLISVATKPTSAPPPPTADCALWDEGWGYTFEVYNIKGWSADGGSGLHHQENGCGALTGWSWSDETSGGQAYFNLPFLIKDGCVERAIVSAGGPKISCKGHGFGKRSTNAKTVEKRADVAKHVSHPPNFDEESIKNAYKPPNADVNQINHEYNPPNWDFERRSLQQPNQLYERGKLSKRGCILSKPKVNSPPGIPPQTPAEVLFCNPVIPGVDECNEKIKDKGNVGKKTSLFYTGWGANGAPSVGGTMARKYAAKSLCDMETVTWVAICDAQWKIDTEKAIIEPFKQPGMSSDELFALNEKADPFLKNLSQAFAEMSKGDVYVFIPKGVLPNNAWNKDSAWGGWEYPALTNNKDVVRIIRVDIDASDANNPTGTKEVIWDRSKGDGKANYDPRGIRGLSLPDGLPKDQIPQGWQNPGSL